MSNWKQKVTLKCQQCGKEIQVIPSRGNQKFCSRECANVARSFAKKFICVACGREFHDSPSKKRRFCSRECLTNN